MDLFQRYGHLLKADGTHQRQRTLPALEPGYVRPDERSLSDLVEYARRLAAEVRFYDLHGEPAGDWRPFLEPLLDPTTGRARATAELEAATAERCDWPPHVALFLTFLELFAHLQDDLNELPERHLRHYYEEVLQLRRQPATADEVHVIFELALNAAPTLVPAASVLDAGQDAQGRALSYATRADLVVSAARVDQVRRLVAETDRLENRRFFVSDAVTEAEGPSWHTFGCRQLDVDADRRFMREAEIGFAVASPLLRMAEGVRELKLTATLRAEETVESRTITHGLIAELTGATDWVKPKPGSFAARLSGPQPLTLEVDLTLDAAAPAIVAFDPALHGGGLASKWPVLRFRLRGESGLYDTLDRLTVERLDLELTVSGVKDLVVHNDQGPLSPDQPMQIFGSQPRLGSCFYAGSAEVFSKRLSSVTLDLEWQGRPTDLTDHYRAYFHPAIPPADLESLFVADVDLLHDRGWKPLLAAQPLFDQAQQTGPARFPVTFDSYAPRPELERLAPYGAQSTRGFLRLVLRGSSWQSEDGSVRFEAFGHQVFPRLFAARAIELSQSQPADADPLVTDDGESATRAPANEEPTLPNEPYTPTLASLSLGYVASARLIPGDRQATDALLTLAPWGYLPAGEDGPARLVPTIEPIVSSGESAGALLLGIDGLEPPANLSLLFQIDSGTATEDPPLAAGDTEWSALVGNAWKTLSPAAVLADGTRGFQQSGVVTLALGADAGTEHTVMPAGLVWLRALVRQPPASAARTATLAAHAALAAFAPEAGELQDYDDHLRSGLAAETITRLKTRRAAIQRVRQPSASSRGRGRERDASFFRRVSERLRHRARAVTAWDFERLVLEAFPEVFKVKCLPHSGHDGDEQAGEAALVIVPDLRSGESSQLLEPRAGAVLMGRIVEFVESGIATESSTLHVIHPVYEQLLADARVAFLPGLDAGYHAGVLGDDLRRFLSPWAFAEGQDIVFGARVYKSEILAFMEGRDYVDFVTDFSLYHLYDGPRRGGVGDMEVGADFTIWPAPRPALSEMVVGDDFVVGWGVEVAEATRPHAILVSHAGHRITPIGPGEERCTGAGHLGIGYMTVGLDFEAHPD